MQSRSIQETESRYSYASFKTYLRRVGFFVYPTEFDCGNSNHPLVDVAAKMGQFYWAFEYKSCGDSISRGVEQVICYSDWFDYVVLVSERWLDHTRSELFWRLRSYGAGIWYYDPASSKCIESKNPSLQDPEKKNRRLVVTRFRAIEKCKPTPEKQAKIF